MTVPSREFPDIEPGNELCIAEGYEARDAGRPMTDNPYPEGSQAHAMWIEGWGVSDQIFLHMGAAAYQRSLRR